MNKVIMFLTLLVCMPVYTQTTPYSRTISWYTPDSADELKPGNGQNFTLDNNFRPSGESNNYMNPEFPVYNELLFAPDYYNDYVIELEETRFLTLDEDESEAVSKFFSERGAGAANEISIEQNQVISRGRPVVQISFVPLRINPVTGKTEKLVSFSYNLVQGNTVKQVEPVTKQTYAGNSVLSNGSWVMISTTEDGVYRITYDDLVDMGIGDPENVRIFGNGNRMLDKMNSQSRHDDLVENKIYINKGSDGIFNQGDYVLFYGQGNISWSYNEATGNFEHGKHLYADRIIYFVTSSATGKERIGLKEVPAGLPAGVIDEFDDYAVHETDSENLIKSGRDWFGEHFNITDTYDFSFRFSNIIAGSQARIRWRAAARSPVASSFSVIAGSSPVSTLSFPLVNLGSEISDYAVVREDLSEFNAGNDNISLSVVYSRDTPSAEGWLDYLAINVRRSLTMTGNQMHFRDTRFLGNNQLRQFLLSNATTGTRIWNISNHTEISEMNTEISGNDIVFNDLTDQLYQYIAFNQEDFLEPEVIGRVQNQNLHGISRTDMVIVTHPFFMNQAEQLAGHRRSVDGLDVVIVTPEQVYNEFSSGKPDVTAIRDFMRMLYDRAAVESDMPLYLLLFGKGSFDNRPGNPSGINFVPTYQSPNSLRPTQSFVSDDFFGLLDEDEGEYIGLVDVGIGRLPVSTPEQAQAVVNKIMKYNTAGNRNDWQNILCFIGDDGDNNIHMRDADILAEGIKETYPVYNIEKIYLDAWIKTGTSLGQRYPDVNVAISERIRKGALIVNYTGHGNDLMLADENIIDINDVLSWKNSDRLPVFMTATCEFSRFDNPERVSAGEMLLLNPNGGSVAMFSTTRLVYATPNFMLNQNFYRFMPEKEVDGREMRLGDIMRLTKINSGSGINKRNFTLLGDPSMKLGIPEHRVVITSVNGSAITEVSDTLKALGKVTISGRIESIYGNAMNDFEGTVYQTVYDKENPVTTLGNDGSAPFNFTSRNNIIYKGKASVSAGEFSFSFIVPKDIAYHYGYGKISSYADNGLTDAAGYSENIIIGGSDHNANEDTEGPGIELFMNDKNFISGGITNQDPLLMVNLTDSSGINTIGRGIGHDITMTMDREPASLKVLNDYYVADADSYQSGVIEYPFSELKEGNYSLQLKAWDVYNNSSEEILEFTVSNSEKFELSHVFNYPNPFTQTTAFHFEHNRPGSLIDVLIQIFTVSGKIVKTIDTTINTAGFKPDPIPWDGLDDYGDRIGRGVYIYRIRLRDAGGGIAEKYEKLVILK